MGIGDGNLASDFERGSEDDPIGVILPHQKHDLNSVLHNVRSCSSGHIHARDRSMALSRSCTSTGELMHNVLDFGINLVLSQQSGKQRTILFLLESNPKSLADIV